MSEQHEIRVVGDRAWCETCDWSDLAHGYYNALTWACLHFSDPVPRLNARGEPDPAWTVCEFCAWPDRVWPAGRPGGDLGVADWPLSARWEWEIRGRDKGWVLACAEHEHLGPSGKPHAYKLLLGSA